MVQDFLIAAKLTRKLRIDCRKNQKNGQNLICTLATMEKSTDITVYKDRKMTTTEKKKRGRPTHVIGASRVNLWLDKETTDKAKEYGSGSISDGIRKIFQTLQYEVKK